MRLITGLIITTFVIATFASEPNSNEILWNNEDTSVIVGKEEEGQIITEEIPANMDRGFKEMLKWHGGQRIVDPNDELKEEIAIMEKILREVFRPGIIPIDSIKDHLLQTNITKRGKQERVLQVRFKTNDYVIKLVKRKYSLHIISRLSSGKSMSSENLAERFFTERILPWDLPSYGAKFRNFKSTRIGSWSAHDLHYYDAAGNFRSVYEGSAVMKNEPIGQGLYGRVDFCTDGKFTCFAISGGPKNPDPNSID
ncbi:MAG: hypothetical protein PHY02_07880 [Phycisphaerae bacterium]|nr:hypothetical protein [Phycisphaerae bacterium]